MRDSKRAYGRCEEVKGVIGNLRVISGPELLRSASLDAIRVARYRPFLLDDEAV